MDITEFRKKYPQYDDMDDVELAKSLHAKNYSDMPFEEFAGKFGVAYKPEEHPSLQPKPTSEVASTLAPIALDIAGGFAASKIPIPLSLLQKAPKVAKAARLGLQSIGAGAGGFGGSLLGQSIDDKPLSFKEAAVQGGIGAGSELLFPLLKFGAKGAKILEDITVSGKMIKGFLRDRIEKKAIARAQQFIAQAAPDVVKNLDQTGDVGKAMELAMDENKIVYQQFKDGIKAAEDANGEIYLNDTVNFLNKKHQKYMAQGMTALKAETEVMKELGYTGNMRKVLRNVMNGDPIDAADFEWIFYNWNPKTYSKFEKSLLPSVKQTRVELKNIMLDDIDKFAGGTGAAKRMGDTVHGAVMEYKNLKDIFSKNIVESEKGIAFYPERLGTDLMKQKNRVMGKDPELWAQLEQEANYYLELSKRLKETRIERIQGGGLSGGAVGYLLGGPTGAASAETIGALSALGTMSDTMANILVGAGKTGVKSTLHMGGQQIDFR